MPAERDEHPAKPATPARVAPRTWRYLSRRTVQEFLRDGCVDVAAALTFFSVLSIFPAGIAIVASIGVLADSTAILEKLLALLVQIAPAAVAETLRDPLVEIAGAAIAGPALIAAILVAIWSASLYVGAFGRAINRIYGVAEGRPYWKRKPAQLGVTVVLMALVLLIIAAVALSRPVSRAVGDVLGIGDTALTVWHVAKWPILAVAAIAMITVLYKGTSNLRQPPLRWLALGALLVLLVAAAASGGLVVYVSHFASYDRTFGVLGGAAVFLVWLFLINLALLLGAEFNAELERGRRLQAGQQAEEHLRLPLRETTLSERAERSAEITVERGARLRRGQPLPPRDDTVLLRAARALRTLRERWAAGRRD